MPLELRSWINPQAYTTGEAQEYEAAGYNASIIPNSATWPDVGVVAAWVNLKPPSPTRCWGTTTWVSPS